MNSSAIATVISVGMDLFRPAFDVEPYTFRGDSLREIAFPLGGIGTGCVSLDGRAGLRDWEIYGRPNKGSFLDHTFPMLWLKTEGRGGRIYPQRRWRVNLAPGAGQRSARDGLNKQTNRGGI